jgi:hypothetical protein
MRKPYSVAFLNQVENIYAVLLNPHFTISRPDGDDGVASVRFDL